MTFQEQIKRNEEARKRMEEFHKKEQEIFKREKEKGDTIRIVVYIMAFVLCIILMVFFHGKEKKNWNDGYCTKCGGRYEFVTAYYEKGFKDSMGLDKYVFKCNSCGKIIETTDWNPMK